MADILVDYKADVGDLVGKLKGVEQANTKVQQSADKTGKAVSDAFSKGAKGATDAQGKINAFSNALNAAKASASGYSNIFAGIGSAIGAAFAVERIIAFASASLKAFQEAEINAKKLQTAVGVSGGLQSDFDNLIAQSEELQKTTIFSDDDIQKAQTLALQYGLTADQVERLIPVITNYASATGDSLTGALNNVIGGLEGNAKALKKQGVQLLENVNTSEQLANITDQLTTRFEGQAQVIGETSAGAAAKLANQFDDLQENFGEFVSGFTDASATILSFILNGLEPLDDGLDSTGNKLQLTTKQLADFGKGVVNANIALLQGQIDRLSAAGGDVSKLNEQLAKLKNQNFTVEINGLTNEELQAKIKLLEDFTFKSQEQSEQLRQLNAEAKKRNLDLIVSEKDLTTLTVAELEKRKTAIELASRETNNKSLQDAIEAITKELEARKKAGLEVASNQDKAYQELLNIQQEFEQKSLESAAKNESEKLEIQRQALLNKAKEILNKAGGDVTDEGVGIGNLKAVEAFLKAQGKINETYDKLISDAKIAEADKSAKAIEAIEAKSRKFVLEQNLQLIEDEGEQAKQLRIKAFNEAGVFTKEAYKVLQNELLAIDRDTIAEQNKERIKGGEQVKSIEKDITNDALDAAEDRVEFTQEEQDRKREIILQTIDAYRQVYGQLFELLSTLRDAEIEQAENSKQAQLEGYDEQLTALEELNESKAYSDRVYEMKKKALLEDRLKAEKKADAEIRKLKTEQAQADKLKAIFETIINTASAITAMLASGPSGIPLAVAAGITGALQLATIIAQPVPKFFKGTSFVERGRNPQGRDTIPAYLNEGERIFSTDKNIKNWDLFEAIEGNRFKEFIHKNHVLPALKEFKQNSETHKRKELATVMGTSIYAAFSGMTPEQAERIRKKGVNINNSRQIAKDLANEIASALPKPSLQW